VVTGGGRGIGLAVADQLAQEGWQVVRLVRDPGRAQPLAAAAPGQLVQGDLSSRRSTRAAAQALLDACPRVDALVHNASIWPAKRERNEDGLELAFAINHLAPFLLNHLLEPRLVASSARVVQVSAGLAVKGRVDLDRTPTGEDFHPIRTYATTKLCNLLLVGRFAERWAESGVTITALHPGVIRTGLGDRSGPLGALLKLVKRRWASPAEGARPVVRLVRDPALATVTGRAFDREADWQLPAVALDIALAARLWTQAGELCELPLTQPAF
jgi:NAD(P)-dependent dehydrogenase (short-subunit alcohol dehydrogenase family)